MAVTEQQLGPVITDYHEGVGGLEAAVWMVNAIGTRGRSKRVAILATIAGVATSIIMYTRLRLK
jgi:hypothetical protein